MGVAALVLGIIGMALSWIPVVGWVGVLLALIAGILGAVAIKKSKKGLGIAGLLLSLGGLGLGLYVQVSTIMAAKEIAQGAEAALKDLQAAQQ